jgi:hypothetical protein
MGMSVALHAANEYCRWSVLPYYEVRGGIGLASVDGAVRCGHNPRCRCSSRGARARGPARARCRIRTVSGAGVGAVYLLEDVTRERTFEVTLTSRSVVEVIWCATAKRAP